MRHLEMYIMTYNKLYGRIINKRLKSHRLQWVFCILFLYHLSWLLGFENYLAFAIQNLLGELSVERR